MAPENKIMNAKMENSKLSKPKISLGDFNREAYVKVRDILVKSGLNTVCVEANCPNRYECFASGTATFMILGDTCTRNCRYCNIKSGIPYSVKDEPKKIAKTVKEMGLKFVVLTSVTRDDLPDGGASVFAECVEEIRKIDSLIGTELLIPDLQGNWDALKVILDSKPTVLNHNIEVVKRLFPKLRPIGGYDLALSVLKKSKELSPDIFTKSGLMVGFGETMEEIKKTLDDLRSVDVDFLTVGQYLAPSDKHAKVMKYYSNEEFKEMEDYAYSIGFKGAKCGALVRSSYKAHELVKTASNK